MAGQDKEIEEIRLLIDDMQSKLVELFDELRELRLRVSHVTSSELSEEDGSVVSLFSKVTSTLPKDTAPVALDKPVAVDPTAAVESSPKDESDTETPEAPKASDHPTPSPTIMTTSQHVALTDTKIARVLDPIAHELNTGDNPAEVIGELLQAAKEELINGSSPNEKVSRDMDIVLKFLRARGKRKIRPEERDNILRRLKRWQTHLTTS